MNDMERRKFEDSFQDAFKDAEVSPSENVWTNIELDLERADGDKMKRRLFFFKTLAAASVVFAMTIAGIGYYVFQNSDTGNVAQVSSSSSGISQDETNGALDASTKENDTSITRANKANGESKNSSDKSIAHDSNATTGKSSDVDVAGSSTSKENENLSSRTRKGTSEGTTGTADGNNARQTPRSKNTAPLIAADQTNRGQNEVTTGEGNGNSQQLNVTASGASSSGATETNNAAAKNEGAEGARKLPTFYTPAQPELKLPVSAADPGMLLLARLAEEEKRYAAEDKKTVAKPENLWTSVGFAAGAFNANDPSVAPVASNTMYSMNSAPTASKQSKASGTSYSVGVNVGTQLSRRWVLQGGVSYMTQTSDYTANSVVVVDNNFDAPKAESINAFAPQLADGTANTKVAQTFPYNVNNSVRFLSVPVQAGYVFVNKKFGFQLNAGLSTDLFLNNTITPDGGGISATSTGRGDESPYRSLNFSGLMGTELSYRIGYRYRLSVNPGLRYPFNSVFKSQYGVESTPLTFDVGLRFKYIFH
jgi:hypothetical protein